MRMRALETNLAFQAVTEADFGDCQRAGQDVALLPSRSGAGGISGGEVHPGHLAGTPRKPRVWPTVCRVSHGDFPAQKVDIPMIRAREQLRRGNGAKAVDELRSRRRPYEFGIIAFGVPPCCVALRISR